MEARALRFVCVSLLLFLSPFVFAEDPVVPPRVVRPVDETERTVLKGNTHRLARPEYDRGSAPPNLPMNRMLLVLKRSPQQESALLKLLDEQQDSHSANYHKWLTPESFGKQFGPADQDIQAVSKWLESHGFQVERIAHGRNLIEFGVLGNATGVDPSGAAIGFCRRRGLENVIQAGLEELPFEEGRFDLLLAFDVIEHIDDDRAAVAELHRVAAPGGQLLITVPAYMWLWSQHDDSHHHKRRYTLRRLRDRVRASGFDPMISSYFNSMLLPPIAAVRLATRRSAPANGRSDYELAPHTLNQLLELPMRGEAELIERGARLPAGVSIAMLCTRR